MYMQQNSSGASNTGVFHTPSGIESCIVVASGCCTFHARGSAHSRREAWLERSAFSILCADLLYWCGRKYVDHDRSACHLGIYCDAHSDELIVHASNHSLLHAHAQCREVAPTCLLRVADEQKLGAVLEAQNEGSFPWLSHRDGDAA